MARLPRVESTQTVATGPATARQPFDSPLAAGVQTVGREVARAEANRDQAWAVQQMADLRAEFTNIAADVEGKSEDGFGVKADMQARFDVRRDQILGDAPSSRAAGLFRQRADLFGADVRGRAEGFERAQRATSQAKALGAAIDSTANLLRTDPTQYEDARADIMATLDGFAATLPADALAVLREGAEQRFAQAALRAGIDDDPVAALAALDSGDFDARLTPDQKNTLFNQATAERDRRRREAERAAAVERGAYLDDAGDYVAFLRAGNLEVPDETLDRFSVANQVAVLGEERAAALQEEIERAWQFGGDANAIRTGSPEEAAAVFEARVEGLRGVGDFAVQRQDFDRLRRLWEDTVAARVEDPGLQALQSPEVGTAYDALLAAQEDGDAEALASAADRYGSLNAAEQDRQGVPEHLRRVLPNRDLERWGRSLEATTPDEATALLGQFHRSHGQAGLDQLAEVLSIDRPVLGMGAFYARRDPMLTSDLLDGARLLEENKDLRPSRDEVEGALQEMYGGLFEFTPDIRDDYREAAVALYARSVVAGDGGFDEEAFERALMRVGGARASARGELTGGPFEFHGRVTLPIAPGEGVAEFETAFFNMDNEALENFGNGVPMGTQGGRIGVSDIRSDAQAVSLGFGRYMFFFDGGNFVLAGEPNDGSSVFVFDMAGYREERGHSFRPMSELVVDLPVETERFIREIQESDLPDASRLFIFNPPVREP